MRYVAFIHRDNEPGFGISFPDFPGCVSDGDTREDTIRRGREALAFHLEGMADDGEAIPPPRSLREIEADPELAEWRQGAELVCIDDIPAPPPLAEEPGDCLLRSASGIFGRSLARTLKPFLVPDLPADGWERVKAALILESPHKSEIAAGFPLAGQSGAVVAATIGECLPGAAGVSGAIGELVAMGDPRVSWLGIVNACRLPLQDGAYSGAGSAECMRHPAWTAWSECIRWIRKRQVGERNEAAILFERAIVQDLQARLDELVNGRPTLLICCGGIARRIFKRTNRPYRARVAYVPHPSWRWWRRNEYRDAIRDTFESIEDDLRTGADA